MTRCDITDCSKKGGIEHPNTKLWTLLIMGVALLVPLMALLGDGDWPGEAEGYQR